MGYGVYATIATLLFTAAIAYSVNIGQAFESAALPLILVGGFISGLFYGLAFRFKGLLFSLLIGFLFLIGALIGALANPRGLATGSGLASIVLPAIIAALILAVGLAGFIAASVGQAPLTVLRILSLFPISSSNNIPTAFLMPRLSISP
jgi:hypothetical protein